MGDGEVAAQRWQAPLVEDLGDHAQVLVDHHALAVADGHAGRLLAAMLEGEERERGQPGRLLAGRVDADDAAHASGLVAQGARQGRPPGVGEILDLHVEGVGHARAALLGGAGGPLADELDDRAARRRPGRGAGQAARGRRPKRRVAPTRRGRPRRRPGPGSRRRGRPTAWNRRRSGGARPAPTRWPTRRGRPPGRRRRRPGPRPGARREPRSRARPGGQPRAPRSRSGGPSSGAVPANVA